RSTGSINSDRGLVVTIPKIPHINIMSLWGYENRGEAGVAERTTPSIKRIFSASLSGELSIAQFLRAVNYLALAVHWRIGYAHHLPNGFRMTIRTHVERMDKFRIIGGKKLKAGVAI